MLDLSYNRFTSDPFKLDHIWKSILDLPNMKYVNMCGNVLASDQRNDFMQSLSTDQLSKLIFIMPNWVMADSWHRMFKDKPELIPVVQRSHTTYYAPPQ